MPKNSKSTRSAKDSSNHGTKTHVQTTGTAKGQSQSILIQRTWPQWPPASRHQPTLDGDPNTSSSQGKGTHQDSNSQVMTPMTPMQRWESETLREGPYNAIYSYAPRYDEGTHAKSSNENVAEHWSTDGNCESQK